MRSGKATGWLRSSVRSSSRRAASSEARRCAVDVGGFAELASSVKVWTPPSANPIRIAVTLLVTDRPGSVEFSADVPTPHLLI